MKILLDTHVFIWLDTDSQKISENAREIIQDTQNTLYLSSISVWEISQKYNKGKLPLKRPLMHFIHDGRIQYDIKSLAFEEESALCLEKLPKIHYDPFDRMLVCQAIQHNMTLVTNDRHMQNYPVKTLW